MTRPRTLGLLAAAVLAGRSTAQTINVEIDYMVAADHTHMPSTAEIDAVVQMFACHGYTLNVFVDDPIPHVDQMRCDFPGVDSFFECTSATYTTFFELKTQYLDAPFGGVGWHYCIFGHDFNNGFNTVGRSGLAETGGNDLVVTLGSFASQVGTPFDRAATFAHELGHNLGLRHWGQTSTGSLGTSAPNYASVMSYQYQLNGIATMMECLGLVSTDHLFKDLDYSSGRLPPLAEGALEEAVGVGIHQVDWNCNGILDAGFVAQDLDSMRPWCGSGGSAAYLKDYDDWSNIQDNARLPSVVDGTAQLETTDCISIQEVEAFRDGIASLGLQDPSMCPDMNTPSIVQSCPSARMIWVDGGASGLLLGNGEHPIDTLAGAVAIAPAGSILYLQPGTLSSAGSPVSITKHVLLTGPGGALVDP